MPRPEPPVHDPARPLLAVLPGRRRQPARVLRRDRLHPERLQQHRRRPGSAQARRHMQRRIQQSRLRSDRPPERRERLRSGTSPFQVSGLDPGVQFRQRPLRPGFGARRERPLPRPHHDRRPAIPPVQRVAVVAHVALVLGLIGRQVRARGGGTHLGVGDVQRYRLAASAVRAGPPAEGNLIVDQVVELVLVIVAAPVPVGVV